jgi:signal transduction histidine kinase
LINVLSNAVKYSPPGSAVVFEVERQKTDAVFRIIDRGIGIPESDLKQLFESFHRASNVGQIPGTGLGMVLVKRCVELHGGTIEVDSKEGQGTTIVVTLPLFKK